MAAITELVLGRIAGVFGVRGEVRLLLYNPEGEWLFEGVRDVTLRAPDGHGQPARLRVRPGAGRRVLGTVEGVGDRDGARVLIGWEIVVPRAALPEPEPGSWYVEELLGCAVRTRDGRALGTLTQIHPGAPVDVWEVHGPAGTSYVPALAVNLLAVGPAEIVVRDEGVVEDV